MTINGQTTKEDVYRNKEVEKELIRLVRLWDEAIVKQNVKTLDNLLADEFSLSGESKRQYLEFIKTSGSTVKSAISDQFDVRVYGETAILIARDTIQSKTGEMQSINQYRYIDVWIKRDGRWQCVATESKPI